MFELMKMLMKVSLLMSTSYVQWDTLLFAIICKEDDHAVWSGTFKELNAEAIDYIMDADNMFYCEC